MNDEVKDPMVRTADLYCTPTDGEGLSLSGGKDTWRTLVRPVENRDSERHPTHELILVQRAQGDGDDGAAQGTQVGALWQSDTKNGEPYLSGTFMDARCLVFRNHQWRGPEDPEFILYVTPHRKGKSKRSEESTTEASGDSTPF